MDALETLLTAVRRRMRLQRMLDCSALALLVLLALALIPLVVSRLVTIPAAAWPGLVLLCATVLALVSVTAFWWPLSVLRAALRVDEAGGLRERVSSAWVLRNNPAPFARAVQRDAARHIHGLSARTVQPLTWPRRLVWVPVPLVLGLLLAWLPGFSLTTPAAPPPVTEAARRVTVRLPERAQELEKLAGEIRAATRSQLRESFTELARDIDQLASELRQGRYTRQEALARVGDVDRQLQGKREELARRLSAIQSVNALKHSDPLAALQKALQQGDFAQAGRELARLQKKLQQGELTAADAKGLTRSLARLSRQLNEADPQTAASLNQLANACKNNPGNGNNPAAQQALQQLQQQLQTMQTDLQQLNRLNQLCQSSRQCKSGMCQGNRPGQGQQKSGRVKSGSCSNPNIFAQGQSTCQSQRTGPFKPGEATKQGNGLGGPGQGRGGRAPFSPDLPTGFDKAQATGALQDQGEIVGSLMVKGQQITGEANVQLSHAVFEHRQLAEDTLDRGSVPLGYRKYVRQYFDAIDPQQQPSAPTEPALEEPGS